MSNSGKANTKGSNKKSNTKKTEAQKPPNEWTVMVYLAGDNNLSEEMIYAIKEMYRVGTNGQFEVIVKFDPSAVEPSPRSYTIGNKALLEFQNNPSTTKRIKAVKLPAGKPTKPQEKFPAEVKGEIDRQTNEGRFDLDGFLEGLADVTDSPDSSAPNILALPKQTAGKKTVQENSGDPETLKNFIRDSIANHRANHYMLVLSGHGSGVDGDFLPDQDPDKPGQLASSLSIPALGKALADALTSLREDKGDDGKPILDKDQGIDILGMDSCLMSMAEVGFEVRKSKDGKNNNVKFLVASEGFELNTGWPYHRILEAMKKELPPKKNMDAATLAKTIVQKYLDYYRDYQLAGASTDISACDLTKMSELAEKVGGLAKALLDGLNDPHIENAIVLAHWDAQTYKGDQYIDLWDFCTRLELYLFSAVHGSPPVDDAIKFLKSPDDSKDSENVIKAAAITIENHPAAVNAKEVIKKCEDVKKAIAQKVVRQSGYIGAAFQHSHGISVYFPWFESDFFPIDPTKQEESLTEEEQKKPLPKYDYLEFAKEAVARDSEGKTIKDDKGGDVGWVSFLRKYLEKSRRERRDEVEHEKRGDEVLHFDAPNETVLFVRGTSVNSARTTDSERSSMKNPPDGFYQDVNTTKKKKK